MPHWSRFTRRIIPPRTVEKSIDAREGFACNPVSIPKDSLNLLQVERPKEVNGRKCTHVYSMTNPKPFEVLGFCCDLASDAVFCFTQYIPQKPETLD